MTKDQIVEVVSKYERELIGYSPERQPRDSPPSGRESVLKHVRWMCLKVREHAEEGRLDKAMRWLGFVQGSLWASGTKSIDSMRQDNSGESLSATA